MLEDLENTIINAGGHGETKKDGQEYMCKIIGV